MLNKKTPIKEIVELTYCEKGCPKCDWACMHGSGVLAQGDKERLAAYLGVSEKELEEKFLEPITKFNTTRFKPKLIRENQKTHGQCIFYSPQKSCTIHPVKPLECKTATCHSIGEQTSIWFNVNFFVNKNDPRSVEEFKTYLASGGKTIPGAELKDLK